MPTNEPQQYLQEHYYVFVEYVILSFGLMRLT